MNTRSMIKVFLIWALPVLVIGFVFIVIPWTVNDQEGGQDQGRVPIGGQRDKHGCLAPAGYSWNEEIGVCIREWEIGGDEAERAIEISVRYLEWRGNTTVIEVSQVRCPGCFVVKLENNSTQDRKTVNIDNWQIKSVSLTPDECRELGGEPLNVVEGATCAKGERNVGEVTGFISPNICCVPSKDK
jgi:hypothetical protein